MVLKEKSEDQQSYGDSSRWRPWMSVQYFMVIDQIVELFHSGGPTGWLMAFLESCCREYRCLNKKVANTTITSTCPSLVLPQQQHNAALNLNESPLKLLSLCWTSRRGREGELMEHSETLFIIFLSLCDGFSTAVIYFSRKSAVLTVSL